MSWNAQGFLLLEQNSLRTTALNDLLNTLFLEFLKSAINKKQIALIILNMSQIIDRFWNFLNISFNGNNLRQHVIEFVAFSQLYFMIVLSDNLHYFTTRYQFRFASCRGGIIILTAPPYSLINFLLNAQKILIVYNQFRMFNAHLEVYHF